jgi:hypothetical protein
MVLTTSSRCPEKTLAGQGSMHDISRLRRTHIDAISAMESMQKNIPTATMRNIHTPPAIPPLARVTLLELIGWSVTAVCSLMRG